LRVVFDTNVFVSALLLPESKPRAVLDFVLSRGKVLVSLPVLNELSEVLARKHLRRYIDEEDVRAFFSALSREAEWVETSITVTACRDPKDNKFLELAIAGCATHVVTGDGDLLDLNPFEGIPILTPQQFLAESSA
jgi:uncharacterized protein